MRPTSAARTQWRGPIDNRELRVLLADVWGPPRGEQDVTSRLEAHSLGWVTARHGDGRLVGCVNVAWDGALHAFLIDTTGASGAQRMGIGTQLVAVATQRAQRAGCRWLHVDFEPELRSFYLEACGFSFTAAGLVDLTTSP